MTLADWLQPFHTRDGWLIVGANLLPLVGVLAVGWDASTLVLLYWLETAVIGLWLLVQVSRVAPDELRGSTMFGSSTHELGGVGLGLFILAHAGVFMAVHFFFLTGLMPGEWQRHLGSPVAFLMDFIIPTGLWVPLLGLFVVRGIITIGDIRRKAPLDHVIIGFYLRIVMMQGTILLGGMITLLLGNPAVLLAILILAKTGVDLYVPIVLRHVNDALEKQKASG